MTRLGTAVGVALVLACAGCGSTTSGTGRVGSTAPASPSSSAPLTPSPTSPETSGVASLPPGPTASPPEEVPPPKACSTSACTLFKTFDAGHGYVLSVHSSPTAAVLELARDGTPVYWRVFDYETPAEFMCVIVLSVPDCVLVDFTGAHAAIAHPIVLAGPFISVGKAVTSDTPEVHALDLDGDTWLDVYGLQNNYEPDYASGQVQWQTWQRTKYGTALVSTGCGTLASTAEPAPSTLLTGACAQ
jgi:hypothetical protein